MFDCTPQNMIAKYTHTINNENFDDQYIHVRLLDLNATIIYVLTHHAIFKNNEIFSMNVHVQFKYQLDETRLVHENKFRSRNKSKDNNSYFVPT